MRAFNIKSIFWLLLLSPLLLAGSGCDNDDDPPAVTLSSISITPSAVPEELPVNVSQQFTAKGTYSDGSVQDLTTTVTWNSSDAAVATINISGLATTLAAGTSNITATSGVTSNTVALNVLDLTLQSVTVSPPAVLFPVPTGSTVQFKAEGAFDNNKSYDITTFVAWATSPAGVLSIDTTGLATAGATPGTTDVTASAAALTSNAVSVTTEVLTAAALIIEPQVAEPVPVNRTRQLLALLRYTNGTVEDVTSRSTWSSSDTAVATVDSDGVTNGLVTGIATGDANITATHNDSGLPDVLPIQVNEASLLAVDILPQFPADLPIGSRQSFIATGFFDDEQVRTLDGSLSWSLNPAQGVAWIRFISEGGTIAVVEGQFDGSVNVIFNDYFADGTPSGFRDEVTLNVTLGALDSIEVVPGAWAPSPNTFKQFTAQGNFGGSFRDITEEVIWESSDTTVGTFDTGRLGNLYVQKNAGGLSTNVTAKTTNSAGTEVVSNTAVVTVNLSTLVGVAITPEDGVSVGETKQYTASGLFSDNSINDFTDRVTWESSDTAIATVSNAAGTEGQVTGVMTGTTTITITEPETDEQDVLDIVVSQP